MSIDPQTLATLKEKLLQEKSRIEEELGRIAKPNASATDFNTNFTEIGDDEDENASEMEEYSDNLAVETTLEKQLKEVNEALERMSQGTYGRCENCNTDIPVERLLAYPAAKTCLNCQK